VPARNHQEGLEQASPAILTEVEVPEDEFVPLSVRTGQRDAEEFRVLHEGVPSHLHPSLSAWIYETVRAFGLRDEVQRRLQIEPDGRSDVLGLIRDDPDLMLDAVDLILWSLDRRATGAGADLSLQNRIVVLVGEVRSALDQASSAYTVRSTQGWRLERRVDETAERAFQAGVEHERHSSDLLKQAWASTFKRDPDPGTAFRASVLAVESVATQAFTPKDGKPSLGKAIIHLRSTVAEWTVSGLDDQQQASGQTLLAMLQTVWENDQRHVGQGGRPPDPATQEEAEAVLFLAVTIVQWFERGFVRKR